MYAKVVVEPRQRGWKASHTRPVDMGVSGFVAKAPCRRTLVCLNPGSFFTPIRLFHVAAILKTKTRLGWVNPTGSHSLRYEDR